MKNFQQFAAQRLTKRQMNDIRGGAEPHAECLLGEQLYTCTLYIDGVATKSTGVVCAYSDKNAENRALASIIGSRDGYSFKCE